MSLSLRARLRSSAAPVLASCLFAAVAPVALHTFSVDETEEPPARYLLTVDGTTTTVFAERNFEIAVGGATYRGSIEPLPTRELTVDGYCFEYPVGMSFEHESEDGVTIWTLEGSETTAMVFRFDERFTLDEMAEIQEDGLGELGETDTSPASMKLGDHEVGGVRIRMEAGPFGLTSEVFPFEDAEDSHLWLILQDARESPDEPTDEFTAVQDVISESFRAVL
ncbi:hypothetical protein Pla163_37470 [Planctomycetes bacterium Pla163]|uniref:Uncharacterized protein n=1 Tax=Rohdeia mirabilis TaxID=2528008 RepID=A0A518D556_9BACT|nr:hypothetical protein Pla163_37470 [Planctomycetes bacterium Pla163]